MVFLKGKKYAYILEKPYCWESWAAPKDKDGKIDHNRATTGADLVENNQDELVQSVACSTDVARITCRVCLKKIRAEVLAALSSEANTPGSRFFQNTVRS